MAKPIKRIGRKFDRTIGLQGQTGVFSRGFKDVVGMPEYEYSDPAIAPNVADRVRPLATRQQAGDNQESSSRELYRRRRARGIATGPTGLMGQTVNRKTLLGE